MVVVVGGGMEGAMEVRVVGVMVVRGGRGVRGVEGEKQGQGPGPGQEQGEEGKRLIHTGSRLRGCLRAGSDPRGVERRLDLVLGGVLARLEAVVHLLRLRI